MSSLSTATVDPTLPPWADHAQLPGDRLIRQARPEEYAAAEDLLVAAFTTGCWVAPDYEQGLRNLAERAGVFRIWVAVDAADRLLGIVLTPRVEYHRDDAFSFSILAVGPHGRGLGLGGLLVDHAVDLARAYGFTDLEIHSSPQMSAAHRLYYSKGFVRRLERETMFVSEYDERLLTFTYRITDPLPADEVQRIAPLPPP
ncbi:MAG: GNAT family N-acetyltransferase, partial [Propionibacteriaceae bacterium]|nr:GNAT family N-acetyltransferase [Propionibacteriaceae bacterium]